MKETGNSSTIKTIKDELFVFDQYVPLKGYLHTIQLGNKACSVRLYPLLFVGGFVSYLRYLCLFGYSGVLH
jgi:hypothetical protein